MLAFEIPGGGDARKIFLEALKLHRLVGNSGVGGSLVIHPASTTHSQLTPEEQLASGVTPGCVRPVGIEALSGAPKGQPRGIGLTPRIHPRTPWPTWWTWNGDSVMPLPIDRWARMVGPSLGGMRVLDWLVACPERVAAALVIGSTAALGADQIGSQEAQIEVIRAEQGFRGGADNGAPAGKGPHLGLGLARRIAQLSDHSRAELELRFGRSALSREDPSAGLARRLDANSSMVLTRAMSFVDPGRNRSGLKLVLSRIWS